MPLPTRTTSLAIILIASLTLASFIGIRHLKLTGKNNCNFVDSNEILQPCTTGLEAPPDAPDPSRPQKPLAFQEGLNRPFPPASPLVTDPVALSPRKIQVAVLLDVSNSMDGLIEQAKAQLWNMVSVLGRVRCDGKVPQVEIALYEYGRSSNDVSKGYVEQVNPFTRDLDEVSKNLFRLTTNGGDEYCGQVMYTSLKELKWDDSMDNYKVIFIAGNEDFLQGRLPFTTACREAKAKGVVVNTIYCGERKQGIAEHWNLGAECGNGSFTNINSDARIEDIPTPYDDELFQLNTRLNATYISYGTKGEESMAKMSEVDGLNFESNKSAALKRVGVKSKKEVYDNSSWDLVDAMAADSMVVRKLDKSQLPVTLKNKSEKEIRQFVKTQSEERWSIQKQIAALSIKRDTFLAAEKAKNIKSNHESTLETAIEKMIREQIGKKGMKLE
ncbi:hypothetical protein KJS94_15505 [Flavihumibacter rivuli]|uniref:vWA domain-containing protein n=1 Tax=Flavihumibacter rivuli TaxID=2838156 RepID=UPI001BDF2A9B|nr:hypothetical protein [Flavihumibacter rivuli]ULQ56054.1 hypothetical protein KJS94_15505 [Flavihumibacter rivuli]